MKRLLIIGNGLASQYLVEALSETNDHGFGITVIDGESTPAYDRIKLTPWLAGQILRNELMNDVDSTQRRAQVTCLHGVCATAIDPHQSIVYTDHHGALPWDALVLATGAVPRRAELPGEWLTGVTPLRALADFEALQNAIRPDLPTVVLGGGTLGIETALALTSRGCEVTLIHNGPWPLHRFLDQDSGRMLVQHLRRANVVVRLNTTVSRFNGTDHLESVLLNDGTELRCNLGVIALGVRPQTTLAHSGGVACRVGVVCDGWLRTSRPNVFALGDCAEIDGATTGTVTPIHGQVKVLSAVLRGLTTTPWSPLPEVLRLDAHGLDLLAAGDTAVPQDRLPTESQRRTFCINDPLTPERRRIDLEQGRLRHFVSIGREHGAMTTLTRRLGETLSHTEAFDCLLDGATDREHAA